MNENSDAQTDNRNIWIRGLFMLLMALAYHVSGTVMFIVSFIQFILRLLNDTPNARMVSFGRSLARYYQQIVNFMTFATEEVPFPFSDWPACVFHDDSATDSTHTLPPIPRTFCH